METITMLIVALAPAVATLISIIIMVCNIVKEFNNLRAEVRDDKTVNEILKSYKYLTTQYKDVVDKMKELKVEIDKVLSSNELTSARIKTLDQAIKELSKLLDDQEV